MAGRKVFNEQDARRCLAAVKASRHDLAAWARDHGVVPHLYGLPRSISASARLPAALIGGSIVLTFRECESPG